MPVHLTMLDVRTRKAWRQWLAKRHVSSAGVWLVRHKQHSGVRSMPYEDLVREALCFGWIDSLVEPSIQAARRAVASAGGVCLGPCTALWVLYTDR